MGIGNELLLKYAINTCVDEINDNSNAVKQWKLVYYGHLTYTYDQEKTHLLAKFAQNDSKGRKNRHASFK